MEPLQNHFAAKPSGITNVGRINEDDNTSDYGSDLDDATATALLLTAYPQPNGGDDEEVPESSPLNSLALENIEETAQYGNRSGSLRVSARLASLRSSQQDAGPRPRQQQQQKAPVEIEVENSNGHGNNDAERSRFFHRESSFTPVPNETSTEDSTRETTTTTVVDEPSTVTTASSLSPLQRFRTPPKKPLSVTDLVSPAWCEQQYEYSLSKYGRVRKTPAMRQGSSVHRELENQVHVQVPVEVVSAEDRFGLRLWNVIQGLRTLRTTGLTRELEVWGVLEEEVVVGVIDEVTAVCPDDEMEKKILEEERKTVMKEKRRTTKKKKDELLPAADQPTLKEFLTSTSQGGSVLENDAALLSSLEEEKTSSRTYYLVDTKTRQSNTIPPLGSRTRPMHMQLMLYHRFLSSLVANEVPAEKLFERYSLNPHARFSDQFIAELSNLDIRSFDSSPSQSDAVHDDDYNDNNEPPTPDPLSELLEHNTLHSLWTLLILEYTRTFSPSSSTLHETNNEKKKKNNISPLLTVQFRSAATRTRRPLSHSDTKDETPETNQIVPAGTLLGQRSFPFQTDRIAAYIADEMRWWRGERATQGVEVEEAFKCGLCEFAEGCAWRTTKVEEGLRRAKARQAERLRRN